MAKGITFDTREQAVEYRDRKHEEGYVAEVTYDATTGKYRVIVTAGFITPPEEEFPKTPKEALEEEAEELEETLEEQRERERGRLERAKEFKEMGKRVRAPFETAAGKIHVKAGMKRAIPTVRGFHPRIGVEGAIGTDARKTPRMMVSLKTPKIAEPMELPRRIGHPYLKSKRGEK